MSSKISDKDRKDWQNFTSSKEKLPNKDFKNQKKSFFKSRTIDLHGYTLEQANRSIEDFIKKSLYKEDFKEFKIPEGIFLTSLNYDTGTKASLGDKNTIIEALKAKDINNISNNQLISFNSYDKLIKYRQFY